MNKISFLIIYMVIFLGCAEKNTYNTLNISTIENISKIEPNKNKQPILGIAFGGGGEKGFIHLGVIKALEEEGIKANIVTGTSAGAIVASLYALGMSFEDIEKTTSTVTRDDISDFVLSTEGLIQGKALSKVVNKITKNALIESTPIKLGIAVTNLSSGEAALITKGTISEAIQASSSVPGAYIPIKSNGNILIDGGILSQVPINFTKALGADIIIGIDIYCGRPLPLEENLFNITLSAFQLQICTISNIETQNADFMIRPDLTKNKFDGFVNKKEAIKVGYNATKKILPDILKKLNNY